MIIALEGVDGSGKTHLANELGKLLSAPIIHHTHLKQEPDCVKKFMVGTIASRCCGDLILDRWIVSDFIYSGIQGRVPVFDREFYDKVCRAFNIVQVYCRPNLDVILDNFGKIVRESWETEDKLRAATTLYDSFYDNGASVTHAPAVKYDYISDSARGLVATLRSLAEQNAARMEQEGEENPIDELREKLGRLARKGVVGLGAVEVEPGSKLDDFLRQAFGSEANGQGE